MNIIDETWLPHRNYDDTWLPQLLINCWWNIIDETWLPHRNYDETWLPQLLINYWWNIIDETWLPHRNYDETWLPHRNYDETWLPHINIFIPHQSLDFNRFRRVSTGFGRYYLPSRGEAVERSFEELRCQRREKFMQCFHQARCTTICTTACVRYH